MKLHQSVLEARADLQIHTAAAAAVTSKLNQPSAAQCSDQSGAPHTKSTAALMSGAVGAQQSGAHSHIGITDSKVHSDLEQLVHEVRSELHSHSVPAGVLQLDEIEELAACGPVGGGKAAYVMAQLLAAAAWKELQLEDQLLNSGTCIAGGKRLKQVLLSSGCFQPGHHTVMQLLGEPAVLQPVVEQQQQQQHHGSRGACGLEATATGDGGDVVVVGWMPNLVHDAYQDVDLV
jgi:hypothetical protein